MDNEMTLPKITFGMIVLNGEPFVRFNLRALYPFAHQIIVAEGASPYAAHAATSDGHSTDATLETLLRFKAEEDPENKVVLVTAEDEGHPDGFWPGEKHEQSQAYATRATGDWLWQIDADEFYRTEDMEAICRLLTDTRPDMVFFYLRVFMYHARLEVHGVEPEYCQCQPIARIFRWGPGYRYVSHRPPTVTNERGDELRTLSITTAEQTAQWGWYIWHYPYLFRAQFRAKARYYDQLGFRGGHLAEWAAEAEAMRRPRYAILWRGLSWLDRFHGGIPDAVEQMVRFHHDYDPGANQLRSASRLLLPLLTAYLRLLGCMRQLSPAGVRSAYRTPSTGTTAKVQNSRLLWLKSRLRRTRLYGLARFLGLVSYNIY
ncbi:MAG: hypothetical protein ACOX3S_04640 [Anaerolineae bacterium]|jgi:hypothetical protein